MFAARHRRNLVCVIAVATLAVSPVVLRADLAALQLTYTGGLDKIAADDAASQRKLLDWYANSLDRLKSRVQPDGDLEKLTTIIDEIDRFNGENMVLTELAPLPELARVQTGYQDHAVRLETSKSRKIIDLAVRYDRALASEETKLVKAGQVEQAMTVREERKQLKTSPVVVDAQAWIASQAPAPKPEPARAKPPTPLDPARLGSLKDGQVVVIPVQADKNTRVGGEVVTEGVYWLDTNQSQGRIELQFKDMRLSSLREKRWAKLRLRIDNHEKAGSRGRVDVFCGDTKVGTFRGAGADRWIEVPLDPQKLPNKMQLTLQLIPRGDDGLAIRSKATGEGPELHIRY